LNDERFACDGGRVKRAGGTPALRNGRVAIDRLLGLREILPFGAHRNKSQKRRPRENKRDAKSAPEASGAKDMASILVDRRY